MSETPPPPPGGEPDQPPPTSPYPQQPPQQPAPQGWQPGWQESWRPATGGPPYGQPPNPQVPYGAPQVPGYGPLAPDHPQATLVLVLGILGLVACQVISPFAWVMGNRVIREIDASGGTMGGRTNANAGRICGIVGTALIGVGLLIAVAVVFVAVIGTATA